MSGAQGIKQVFVTELTGNDASPKDELGDIRFAGNKVYKYVTYNQGTGTVAAVAGNMTAYHGDDGYDGNDVTSDYTDGTVGAGVLQAALTHTYAGWVQIKGLAILTPALTAGADFNPLTCVGAGDGTLDVVANDAASGYLSHVCAVAIDASLKKVILNCPY